MSCAEVAEMLPMTLQPGFSFAVAFEALHSRLALELRKKCQMQLAEVMKCGESESLVVQECPEKGLGDTSTERYLALHKQINEVQNEVQVWRADMGEMFRRYETKKCQEFARLREESEKQVLLARLHAEQQVECVKKLHATKVQELYDLFMQTQKQEPITEELLASIQTRTNLQLRDVLEAQQQQIQELQSSNLLSHLKEQSLQEETSRLRLTLLANEEILTSLKTEIEEFIPKLHGYIDAREHLLTMTLKEKTGEDLQRLELSLRNEQRENAWMQRALKENKRKRSDRLSRLQQEVTELTKALAEKDDIIAMLERGFRMSNLKDAFRQWQPERAVC